MHEKDPELVFKKVLKTLEMCSKSGISGGKRHLNVHENSPSVTYKLAPVAAVYGPSKFIRVCNFLVFIFSAAGSEPGRTDERPRGRLIG